MKLLNAVMGSGVAICAAAEAGPDAKAPGWLVARVPFELEGNLLYVTGRAGDVPGISLLVETGAGMTALDEGLIERLGVEITSTVPGAGAGERVVDVRLGTLPRLDVGGAAAADMPVAFMPLGHLWPMSGRRFDGLLGQDFLRRFSVEIDYAARELRLHDPGRFEYAGTGERLRFTSSMNLISVDATVVQPGIDPATGRFVIDTGAGDLAALVLSAPFVADHALLRPGQPILSPPVGGHGIGGAVSADIGRVAELRLGAVAVRDVLATFTRGAGGFFAGGYAGVIGNETLRRFRVFIDYGRSEIVLEPNAALDEPFLADAGGITLHAEGAGLDVARVARVLDGSPAAEAGVQAGDVLLAIDGRPVRNVAAARDLLRAPGRYELHLGRGGQALKLSIETRSLI